MKIIKILRRLVAFTIILVAIMLPIGVFNPFTAGDYLLAGDQPPSIGETLLWLIPVEIILLGAVFLIDPKKKNKED